MLAILTGNVGINGGNSGAREGSYSLPFVRMPTFETQSNQYLYVLVDRCH